MSNWLVFSTGTPIQCLRYFTTVQLTYRPFDATVVLATPYTSVRHPPPSTLEATGNLIR